MNSMEGLTELQDRACVCPACKAGLDAEQKLRSVLFSASCPVRARPSQNLRLRLSGMAKGGTLPFRYEQEWGQGKMGQKLSSCCC